MKRAVIYFAACSALALMALAALPLGAAELSHRWSFNGDYSDSVGGADAVKCGTYVSLYGGRVHMGYGACSHGTGYVDLGKNMLDTTAATIEIWARHDGVESWSRVFDYGSFTTMRGVSTPPGIEVGKDRMLWNSLCPLGGDKFLLVSECKGRIRIDTGTVAEGRITRK